MIIFSSPKYKHLAVPLLKLPNFKSGVFGIRRFPNQELQVSVRTKVKGKKCIIIGGTASLDDELFKFLLLSHTLKIEGAQEIIAFIPYLSYSRQDKKEAGKSLAALWLGEALRASGVNKVITIDIHSPLAKILFPIPLISFSAEKIFAKAIAKYPLDKITLVAPDEGAIKRCVSLGKILGISKNIAYFKKKRTSRGVIISLLHGKVSRQAIVVDDILDTGETLVGACKKLRQEGAREITILITHGLFTGKIWEKLWPLGVRRIYCTDSVPETKKFASEKIVILPLGHILIQYFL